MTFLSSAATDDYLDFTLSSYYSSIIGKPHFLARLDVLSAIGDQGSPSTKYAQSILAKNDYQSEDDEWNYVQEGESQDNDGFSKDPFDGFDYDDDGLLYFNMRTGPLKDWYFRPGDPDPIPSIPHGHWKNHAYPKLDAYLGWVSDKTKQIRRIKRKDIIHLWNHEPFRKIAAAAIDHHYNGQNWRRWRVPDPFSLPRRRKF